MNKIIRANSENLDFQTLVKALDQHLAILDGDEHAFFAQFNKTNALKHVVVLYHMGKAVGCGAIKEYEIDVMEVKRMYVLPEQRGKGMATFVLEELEEWALELGIKKCILETSIKQPEAIRLYTKNNYSIIENYGQYAGIESSICFEKIIN